MIFGVATLVSYVSRFITLEPADLITTGTPPGVGLGHKPQPMYLKPGDTMRLGSRKLGEQRQKLVAWRRPIAADVRLAVFRFCARFATGLQWRL